MTPETLAVYNALQRLLDEEVEIYYPSDPRDPQFSYIPVDAVIEAIKNLR